MRKKKEILTWRQRIGPEDVRGAIQRNFGLFVKSNICFCTGAPKSKRKGNGERNSECSLNVVGVLFL